MRGEKRKPAPSLPVPRENECRILTAGRETRPDGEERGD